MLHNFRMHMRTTREPRRGSHLVALLLLLRKKTRGKTGHAQDILPARTASGQGHFQSRDFVTSGQKAPLGRKWCHFRLRMRRTYFRTGHVTDVTSGHVTDFTSDHVTSGHAQWSDPPHDPPQMWLELSPYTTMVVESILLSEF